MYIFVLLAGRNQLRKFYENATGNAPVSRKPAVRDIIPSCEYNHDQRYSGKAGKGKLLLFPADKGTADTVSDPAQIYGIKNSPVILKESKRTESVYLTATVAPLLQRGCGFFSSDN